MFKHFKFINRVKEISLQRNLKLFFSVTVDILVSSVDYLIVS